MLDRILELLKTSGADGWEVTDKVAETWEFYLIRHALDQNRVKNLESFQVKVYKKGGWVKSCLINIQSMFLLLIVFWDILLRNYV